MTFTNRKPKSIFKYNGYPFGSSADPFSKRPGASGLRGFVKLFIGKVCVNLSLFFWRCSGCNLLLWNLWSLEQTYSWNLPNNSQQRTKGAPQEATNRSNAGTPKRVRKTGRETNVPPLETITQRAPKWDPTSDKLAYFVLICFHGFVPHHLLDSF